MMLQDLVCVTIVREAERKKTDEILDLFTDVDARRIEIFGFLRRFCVVFVFRFL